MSTQTASLRQMNAEIRGMIATLRQRAAEEDAAFARQVRKSLRQMGREMASMVSQFRAAVQEPYRRPKIHKSMSGREYQDYQDRLITEAKAALAAGGQTYQRWAAQERQRQQELAVPTKNGWRLVAG